MSELFCSSAFECSFPVKIQFQVKRPMQRLTNVSEFRSRHNRVITEKALPAPVVFKSFIILPFYKGTKFKYLKGHLPASVTWRVWIRGSFLAACWSLLSLTATKSVQKRENPIISLKNITCRNQTGNDNADSADSADN